MRFRKGTKVEVLTQDEVPSGSWRCAEIIGGNGRNYAVKYEGETELFGRETVESVPRQACRPCPPPVDVLQDWVSGDVVEVFHNFSWKMATVLKVLGRNHLMVRILGSAIEFKANLYDVRPRLCFQNGEWIVIGKAQSKCEDMAFRFPSSRKDNNQPQRVSGHMKTRNTNGVLESQAISFRTLKRKPSYCHSQIEACAGLGKKIRVGKRGSMGNQSVVMQQPQLPEKVDDVACSRELLREKCMHSSFINKITGCSEMILEREKTYGAVGYSRSVVLESNDDDSVSSVASCSVNRNSSHRLHHVFGAGPFEDNDSQCSDAESFCHLRCQEENILLPAKEELTDEIHRLELHAYRCTIGALYASGPLSWEQELLLTNLRDSLHISNDEHLMEIRNLVSSSTCIPFS